MRTDIMRKIDQELGRRFIELRKSLGLTQTEIAEKIGIHYTSYQSYEKGAYPNGKNIRKISNAINVSFNWLLSGDGEMFFQDENGRKNDRLRQL